MKEFIKKIYGIIFFTIFKIIPLQNKVVFSSFSGKRYGDNPKIISDRLLQTNPEIKQVWLYTNKEFETMPKQIIQKKWSSIGMIYELATAKVWVDSHTKPTWVSKRKNQFFIETWHGGLGMKKIEADAEDKLTPLIIKRIKHNSSMVDVLISNSDWLTKIYKRAFWYDGKIEKTGYPKTDFLLNLPEGIKEKVYKYYNFEKDVKIFLYAPTMRDHPKKETFYLDTKNILKALEKKYGENWKILIRLHPINESFITQMDLSKDVIDATKYPDMLELISASEMFITDYSSGIFDAAVIKKKSMIFALDEEEYNKERGLYMKLDTLPFLVSRSNDELCENIEAFDESIYEQKLKQYFEEVGLYDDGHATEKIVKMITDRIGE